MAPSESRPTRLRNAPVITAGAIAAIVIGVLVAFATSGRSAEPPATATPRPTPTASPTPSPRPTERPAPSPTPSPTPIARCPLDGMPLAAGVDLPTTALAVQIENHPAARPTRNLSKADMVIETTVEGDMTRFTAVYLCDQTLGMTGPVRSARYYNIDFWQDLHVLTVAFGRSDGAYARFVDAGMPFANGMDGGWPWFQRYGPRPAPHNLYLDLEAMRDGLEADAPLRHLADAVDELRPPFGFDERPDLPPDGRAVATVEMRTNGYWTFGWTWDGEAAWRRTDGGEEAVDEATGEPVAATSVVVQRVTQETVYGDPDPGGNPRRLQHLVGSGTGTVYLGGKAYAIDWSRSSEEEGTTFTFAHNDKPVVLPPGQVWWEILPVESSLTEG